MSPAPGPPPPARVGLRAVAKAAGVCLMTASLALRNSPRLALATGARVRSVAARLGYRPDPEISRLMGRLRPSRQTHGSIVIAMIDLHRDAGAEAHPYDEGVRRGIAARADTLGFGVSIFRIRDYPGGLAQMLRVIRHRGITGAILLPSGTPAALDPALRWEGLSVVSATTTVSSPQFHRVVPDQLHNIMTLIDDAHLRGYRKLGAILGEALERRTNHHYSMALAWHGHRERILVLPDAMPSAAAELQLNAFLKRHTPDLIFGGDALTRLLHARKLTRLPTEIELVALTSQPGPAVAYLDQRPDLIGKCAVSLLTGMMHNNETGIPAEPQITTVRGHLAQVRTSVAPKDEPSRPSRSGRRLPTETAVAK